MAPCSLHSRREGGKKKSKGLIFRKTIKISEYISASRNVNVDTHKCMYNERSRWLNKFSNIRECFSWSLKEKRKQIHIGHTEIKIKYAESDSKR